MMTDRERQEHHERVSDLAGEFLRQAMSRGEPFCEGLTDWAMNKALREIGNGKND